MAAIGWPAKRNRDGAVIRGCWITDSGYTVAEMYVEDLVAYGVTPPGKSAPVAYRTTRDEVIEVIQHHMAGQAVTRFGVGAC